MLEDEYILEEYRANGLHGVTEADVIRSARLAQLEVGQLYLAESGVELVVVMFLGIDPKPMFKPKSAKVLYKEKICHAYPETLYNLDSPPEWWTK